MIQHPSSQRSETWRPREALRDAERRSVEIRKKLNQLIGQRKGHHFRGVMEDAVKLACTIEHLARYGQVSTADEAADIESHIEVLTWILRGEIGQIIAS